MHSIYYKIVTNYVKFTDTLVPPQCNENLNLTATHMSTCLITCNGSEVNFS